MSNINISNTLYIGKTQRIKLPSGKEIIIRENNGDDEGVLSNFKDTLDHLSTSKYLALVTVHDFDKSPDESEPIGVSLSEVLDWKVNDRYYALFAARVLSLGQEFKFEYTCQNPRCNHKPKEGYTEDLTQFLTDTPNYPVDKKPLAPPVYPEGQIPTIILALASGRQIKFDILTGIGEKKALDIPQDSISKNAALTIRNLHIKHGEIWEPCYHFKMFSSKDMAELRGLMEEKDPTWEPLIEIECPKCEAKNAVPILSSPDFFFPTGI